MRKTFNKTSLLLAAAFFLFVIGAQGATLTIDNTADSGVGTFRQALIDATANAAANDLVFAIPVTDPGYDSGTNSFTIALTSQLPDVPLAATTINHIQPQAITIMGDTSFPIFTLVNSAVVVMDNLTISNGFSGSMDRPTGMVTRTRSARGTSAPSTIGNGGGIYMGDSGTLTLNGCTVANNGASSLGGGIYMSNSATLHMHNSTVSGNAANHGGGIFINDSGTLNIDTSTISGNDAHSGHGGAIYIGTSGTVNATNNTFDGNNALGYGGAIYNTATMTLTNNTITSNTAGRAGGLYNGATATLNSNIVAKNTAVNEGQDLIGEGAWGIAFTGTYNLIGNTDYSEGLNTATNQTGNTASPLDPMVGPLRNNGGKVFTRALLFGSPAIDKGNAPGLITDERGMSRPVDDVTTFNPGDGSDIGAYEFRLSPTAASVSVGGRVVSSDNRSGVSNAVVVITAGDATTRTAISNRLGYFTFTDVSVGGAYVITVTHKRFEFDPQVVIVTDDVRNLTFTSASRLH